LCKIFYNRKEYDQAVEYFDKALELYPEFIVEGYWDIQEIDMINEIKHIKQTK